MEDLLILSIIIACVSMLLVSPCMIYCRKCALRAISNIGEDEEEGQGNNHTMTMNTHSSTNNNNYNSNNNEERKKKIQIVKQKVVIKVCYVQYDTWYGTWYGTWYYMMTFCHCSL